MIEIFAQKRCEACGGTGRKGDKPTHACARCKGSGAVHRLITLRELAKLLEKERTISGGPS